MRNSAMKIAALSAALSIPLMAPVMAEDLKPVEASKSVATPAEPAEVSAPGASEPITNGDGEVVTLQVLQNEVEWRAATAAMLKKNSPVYR